MALVFGHGDDPRLVELASRLAARDDVALCCVTPEGPSGGPDIPMWSDSQGTVAAGYGIGNGGLTAIVLDPNLRVIAIVAREDLPSRVVELLDSAVHRGAMAEVRGTGPGAAHPSRSRGAAP